MTDDSFVHEEMAEDPNVDPLTAPFWPVVEGEVVLLDPEVTEESRGVAKPQWITTSAPQPPNVDQILRGEYTGWVPIIKAGESLRDAETRAEEKLDRIEATIEFEETFPPEEGASSEMWQLPSQILDPLVVTPPVSSTNPSRNASAWTNLVDDPDTVKSPAAALEEARARIQAMRDSLQYNIRRVSESFEHPVFSDGDATDVFVETDDQPSMKSENETNSQSSQPEPHKIAAPTVVIESPAHEYVTSSPLGEAVAESKAPDTSLELMIMRDEIKDLRTRLDASQKLIEDLMHRLTNLTELALKSRQN